MKRRIFSVITAFAVTVSCAAAMPCGFITGAYQGGYVKDTETADSGWLAEHSDNLLTAAYCNIKSDCGGWSDKDRVMDNAVDSDLIKLTDGSLESYFDNGWNLEGDCAINTRLTFNIGYTADIKQLLISCINQNGNSQPLSIELYVGNSEADLFNAENKAAELTGSDILANSEGTFLLTFDSVLTGACVGAYIKAENCLKIREIGAYVDLENSRYTVKRDAADSEWLTAQTNALTGKLLSVTAEKAMAGFNRYDVSDASTGWLKSQVDLMADGVRGDSSRFSSWISADAEFSPVCISYDLGKTSTVYMALLAGRPEAYYAPQSFEIYVSNDADSLYETQNRVVSFKNTDSHLVQPGGKYVSSWLIEFTNSNEPSGRYIGFRILKPNLNSTDVNSLHIEELGVYTEQTAVVPLDYTVEAGTVDTDWVESDDRVNALTYSSCRMVIPQLDYDIKKVSDDGKVETVIANMTDGALGSTSRYDRWFENYQMTGTTITYNLGYTMPIKQIMFAGDLTEKHWSPTGFSVYVSDTESDLYNAENRKITYTPASTAINSWVFTFNEGSVPSGKFIGFKLDSTTELNVKIEELGAYADLSSGFSVEKSNVTEDWFSSAANKNLLKDADVKIEAEGDMTGFVPIYDKSDPAAAALVDEDTNTRYEALIENGFKPVRITYDLKSEKQIVHLMLASLREMDVNASPQNIEIYISNNKQELYDGKNSVISYNNRDSSIGEGRYYDSSYAFRLSSEQPRSGRYIGFRILNPNGSGENNYLRISELGAYSEYIIPKTPIPVPNYTYDVEENIVTQEYLDSVADSNLIRYSSIEKSDRRGNVISDSELSALVDGTVYDGDDGNSSTDKTCYRYWASGRGEVRFTFDMLQSVPVDKVMFASYYNPSADFCTALYAVYISDSREDLYSGENCVIVWDNTGKYVRDSAEHAGGNQIFTFTGEKPMGRYVGFAVLESNPMDIYIRIEQLGVFADGVKPKNRDIVEDAEYPYKISHNTITQEYLTEHLLDNMIMNSTPVFTEDKYGQVYPEPPAGRTERMTDGKIRSDTEYVWWINEWETLRITYDMGQSVPIDRIVFVSRYLYYADTLTRNYEIYIGDNQETLYNAENRVVAYDNTGYYIGNRTEDCPGADQIFDFYSTKPKGRYIGFRIINPSPFEMQDFGTSQFIGCAVAIDQIAVYSQGNKPGDPLYAQSFIDEATGAECLIRKLEFSDSFNEAASFKIEKIEISDDVLKYLSKNYLELADNAYRIILKDAAGNVMTAEDLGGRQLEIHLPSTLENDGGDIYLCQYTDGGMRNLNAYFDGKTVVALIDEPGELYLLRNIFTDAIAGLPSENWNPLEEIANVVIDDSPEEITVYDNVVVTEEPEMDSSGKKVIQIIKRRRVASSGLPLLAVIAIAAGGVVLVGGTVTALILVKRKKSNKERGKSK